VWMVGRRKGDGQDIREVVMLMMLLCDLRMIWRT